ncbi:hypothetical protein PIROE2DRAFT_4528 [Piromyces sp. E2]|nr:hypothetical protein PIROE2DRAFT_4528 [Piromyces sp. E2]|eukprot:OUM67856.1 hypothetical protein PIROE2DRAFT_4528 [Piromyces sp. E2]
MSKFQLILKYGKIVLELLGIGMTLTEIAEWCSGVLPIRKKNYWNSEFDCYTTNIKRLVKINVPILLPSRINTLYIYGNIQTNIINMHIANYSFLLYRFR